MIKDIGKIVNKIENTYKKIKYNPSYTELLERTVHTYWKLNGNNLKRTIGYLKGRSSLNKKLKNKIIRKAISMNNYEVSIVKNKRLKVIEDIINELNKINKYRLLDSFKAKEKDLPAQYHLTQEELDIEDIRSTYKNKRPRKFELKISGRLISERTLVEKLGVSIDYIEEHKDKLGEQTIGETDIFYDNSKLKGFLFYWKARKDNPNLIEKKEIEDEDEEELEDDEEKLVKDFYEKHERERDDPYSDIDYLEDDI